MFKVFHKHKAISSVDNHRNKIKIKMDFGSSMVPYATAPGALMDPYWPTTQYGYGGPSALTTATSSLQPLLRAQRREMQQYSPILVADLVERADGSYVVHSDLPGVDAKDLDISIDGDQLVIKAERVHLHAHDADTVHLMERTFGQVQRTLRLPPNCDANKADVKFSQGVLEISFPKKAGATGRKKLAIK